jgi:hypothetical protein
MNSELIKRKKLLETPVDDLELPVRAYNCVRAAKIETLGELINCTKEDLAEHRNFGQKSIAQVEQVLENMGLTLKSKSKSDVMKIELVKEQNLLDDPFYTIYVDGRYRAGSSHEFKTKRLYFEIISDPSILENTKEILHSAEFIVASEYKK